MDKNIFFYDGECGFCNRTVMFLFYCTTKERLYFSPIQSDFAAYKLKELGEIPSLDSAYLIRKGALHKGSSAVLFALTLARFPYNLISCFLIIPGFIREFVYSNVAKIRKRIPFIQASCIVLSPVDRKRFI